MLRGLFFILTFFFWAVPTPAFAKFEWGLCGWMILPKIFFPQEPAALQELKDGFAALDREYAALEEQLEKIKVDISAHEIKIKNLEHQILAKNFSVHNMATLSENDLLRKSSQFDQDQEWNDLQKTRTELLYRKYRLEMEMNSYRLDLESIVNSRNGEEYFNLAQVWLLKNSVDYQKIHSLLQAYEKTYDLVERYVSFLGNELEKSSQRTLFKSSDASLQILEMNQRWDKIQNQYINRAASIKREVLQVKATYGATEQHSQNVWMDFQKNVSLFCILMEDWKKFLYEGRPLDLNSAKTYLARHVQFQKSLKEDIDSIESFNQIVMDEIVKWVDQVP